MFEKVGRVFEIEIEIVDKEERNQREQYYSILNREQAVQVFLLHFL